MSKTLWGDILTYMFETEKLIEIVSGKKTGVTPSAIRWGLAMLTPIYRSIVAWRNRRFDNALANPLNNLIKTAGIPVISIGNLTTGGTGKTPHVIWIANHLATQKATQNPHIVIVSRGYGAIAEGTITNPKRPPSPISHPSNSCPQAHPAPAARNDEALELEFRLPDVPHLQNPDRHAMIQTAIDRWGSQIALLDDGFQHRQLHRDLDIVLIDATDPFGYGWLLPRGLLREPIQNLRRADVIVLTRCDLALVETREHILERLRQHNTTALIAQSRTCPQGWLQFDGGQFPLDHLAHQKVFSFCGIGNPDGFLKTLDLQTPSIVGHRVFADHHRYTRVELESVAQAARNAGATAMVCTHKDLVKIGDNQIDGLPVYALLIGVEFTSGQSEFETKLTETLSR